LGIKGKPARHAHSSYARLAAVPSKGGAAIQPRLWHTPQRPLMLSIKRFRSSYRKSKKRRKQRDAKVEKVAPTRQRTSSLPTHADNGRLIVTEEVAKDIASIRLLNVNESNAKNLLHQVQSVLGFRLKMSHQPNGPRHEQVFVAQIQLSGDKGMLDEIPNVKVPKGKELRLDSCGAARRKVRAELFATMDMLVQLHEIGIHPRNLDNIQAIRKQQAKDRFKEKLRKAQMLLELCNASKPKFQTETGRRNTSHSEVTMFVNNKPIMASASGGSKAEAEDKAIIAAAGAPLQAAVGIDLAKGYESLFQESPGGHVAALSVDPLPEECIDELMDSLGSLSKHAKRMKYYAAIKAEFGKRFKSSKEKRSLKLHGNNNRNTGNAQATNAAFLFEETTRANKAREDPDGKQGRMKAIRDALSIKAIRQELLDKLKTEQVVVVSGGTGSGKSTQCPQYILEDAIAHGKGVETHIIVTQPRRIAAISVAERVAAERDERIGNSVGYTVRFNRQSPRATGGSIEFVTTGVLLRRLMNDPALDGVSHVMIDEVHERDIDTDYVLVLLKELLTKRPELRVILMSATLDAESFGNYFSQGRETESTKSVPVMSVPAKPFHSVEILHLEDMAGESNEMDDDDFPRQLQALAETLLEVHDQQLQLELDEAHAEEKASAGLEPRSYAEDEGEILGSSDSESDSDYDSDSDSDDEQPRTRAEILRRAVSIRNEATGGLSENYRRSGTMAAKREVGEITVSMVAKIAAHVVEQETAAGRKGSILCFLPGWDEITAAIAALEELPHRLKRKMSILPLHSTIPQEDQHKVFEPAEHGTMKVILATNIAESSVTIDDVLVVIDSGLVREMNYDAQSAMSTIETVPISRASATQRLGRAGRVAPGKCYRLYSRGALQAMSERPTPEIQRTPLEATCLQTCSVTSNGVANFLLRAMDPPSKDSVSFAMDRLVKLGAIANDTDGGEVLTPVGRCLSRLPLDPAMGRMLIMGCVMKCLDPILTAAACLSSRDAFYSPLGMRDEARQIRQSFCDSSDLMATVRAYDTFQDIIDNKGWDSAKRWASDNFVSLAAMQSIRSVRSQLLDELNRIGLVPNNDLVRVRTRSKQLREGASVNQNADVDALYSAIWATGLPGNLGVRRKLGSFGTFRTRYEDHAGLHPSSVAFHRKPPRDRVRLARWFVYHEMVLSSQVFLRGCTALKPEQVLLFGGYNLDGPKQPESSNGESMDDWIDYCLDDSPGIERGQRVLDDWIVVEGQCQDTIDLLSCVRAEINAALDLKVMQPHRPLPDDLQSIIETVCYILGDDEVANDDYSAWK
jgi:HrpA-like RNA helicase